MRPTSRLLLALAAASGAALLGAADPARAAAPTPHELGWVCFNVSDVGVSQVSAFNRDSPMLSIWVPKARLYTEAAKTGKGGRVCAPAVIARGTADIPKDTLVFERVVQGAGATSAHQSTAEFVVTPLDPHLGEVTLELTALPENWNQRDGTWTFQSPSPINFPDRPLRTLPGDGDGPTPDTVFQSLVQAEHFHEPCQPMELTQAAPANFAVYDPRTGKATARGVEPLVVPVGTKVSRCDGVSMDTLMVAIARPADDAKPDAGAAWYLVPQATPMKPIAGMDDTAYAAEAPLGGYHVCRQPAWTSAVMEDITLAGVWELDPDHGWRRNMEGLSKIPGAMGQTLPAGTTVDLLDTREGWAVISAPMADGQPHVFAVKGSAVALPSGPSQSVLTFDGGLCPVALGQWRATKQNAQAFKVSQDTPGSELAGLWVELTLGTEVLQMCQTGAASESKLTGKNPPCSPVYVGGAQGGEGDRFVLVRYAAQNLAVRETDLRDRTTGEFATREDRPYFWRSDNGVKQEKDSGWVFGLGPGARISFVDQNDFGWTVKARLQHITEKSLGFEGSVAAGGDGYATFIALEGGVGKLLYRFSDEPFELRAGLLGKLDFYASNGGGLGFDVVGKAQLRWVNDTAPVSLELGVDLGYGGTFGGHNGHFRFGMPVLLVVELATF